jgi:hypothetical protein
MLNLSIVRDKPTMSNQRSSASPEPSRRRKAKKVCDIGIRLDTRAHLTCICRGGTTGTYQDPECTFGRTAASNGTRKASELREEAIWIGDEGHGEFGCDHAAATSQLTATSDFQPGLTKLEQLVRDTSEGCLDSIRHQASKNHLEPVCGIYQERVQEIKERFLAISDELREAKAAALDSAQLFTDHKSEMLIKWDKDLSQDFDEVSLAVIGQSFA